MPIGPIRISAYTLGALRAIPRKELDDVPPAPPTPDPEWKLIKEGVRKDGVRFKELEHSPTVIQGNIITAIRERARQESKNEVVICLYLDPSGSMVTHFPLILSQFAKMFKVLGEDESLSINLMLGTYDAGKVNILLPMMKMDAAGQVELVRAFIKKYKVSPEVGDETSDAAINDGSIYIKRHVDMSKASPFIVVLSDAEAEEEDIATGYRLANKEESIRNAEGQGVNVYVFHDLTLEFSLDESGKQRPLAVIVTDTAHMMKNFTEAFGEKGKEEIENIVYGNSCVSTRIAAALALDLKMDFLDAVRTVYKYNPSILEYLARTTGWRSKRYKESSLYTYNGVTNDEFDFCSDTFGFTLIDSLDQKKRSVFLFELMRDAVRSGRLASYQAFNNLNVDPADLYEGLRERDSAKDKSELEKIINEGTFLIERFAAFMTLNPDANVIDTIRRFYYSEDGKFRLDDSFGQVGYETTAYDGTRAFSFGFGINLLKNEGSKEATLLLLDILIDSVEAGYLKDISNIREMKIDPNIIFKTILAWYDDPCYANEEVINQLVGDGNETLNNLAEEAILDRMDDDFLDGLHLYAMFSCISKIKNSAKILSVIDDEDSGLARALTSAGPGWVSALSALLDNDLLDDDKIREYLNGMERSGMRIGWALFAKLVSRLTADEQREYVQKALDGSLSVSGENFCEVYFDGVGGDKKEAIEVVAGLSVFPMCVLDEYYQVDPKGYVDYAVDFVRNGGLRPDQRSAAFNVFYKDAKKALETGRKPTGLKEWDDMLDVFLVLLKDVSVDKDIRLHIARILPLIAAVHGKERILSALEEIVNGGKDPIKNQAWDIFMELKKRSDF